MKNKLLVFTNSRNIREFILNSTSGILPKSMSIGAFFKEAIYSKNFSECGEIAKILHMNEAVKKTKNLEKALGISQNFFSFLRNREYLFSFFKELSISKKSVLELKSGDTYAEYDEHLEILENLLLNYKNELKNAKVYDDITITDDYEIDREFIGGFDEIEIYIDGVLSEFDFEILSKVREISNTKIHFKVSPLNQNLTSKISKLFGVQIDGGFSYLLDITLEEILEKTPLARQNEPILLRSFSSDLLQVLYIFEKISSFIRTGIEPKNIAVILPDESFSEILKAYDFSNMLNFAMGKPFSKTAFYTLMSEILECFKELKSPLLNPQYLKNEVYKKTELFLNSNGLKQEFYDKFLAIFDNSSNFSEFLEFVSEISSLTKTDNALLKDSLYQIELFLQNFSLKFGEICEIFLMLTKNIQIPHVSGGEVSVMGILEARGMRFDGVIVPCFSDELVPNRSVNEMFLNSAVRKRAGLISYKERENLQRFYYKSLINQAKKVAICYNQNSSKSRFLNEFNTQEDLEFCDESYLELLDIGKTKRNLSDEPIKKEHDFFASELSFSRLDRFLKCKRWYYYDRVLKLTPAKPVDDEKKNLFLGSKLHELLKNHYKTRDTFDYDEFKRSIQNDASLSPLEKEIFTLKFMRFNELMKELESDGFRVKHSEKEIRGINFENVKIGGKIDRIDENGSQLLVIDYKLGNPDKNSLQLAFYEALLGVSCEKKFLSFKDMSFTDPNANLDALREKILELKDLFLNPVQFEKNLKSCEYCPYTIICKRSFE